MLAINWPLKQTSRNFRCTMQEIQSLGTKKAFKKVELHPRAGFNPLLFDFCHCLIGFFSPFKLPDLCRHICQMCWKGERGAFTRCEQFPGHQVPPRANAQLGEHQLLPSLVSSSSENVQLKGIYLCNTQSQKWSWQSPCSHSYNLTRDLFLPFPCYFFFFPFFSFSCIFCLLPLSFPLLLPLLLFSFLVFLFVFPQQGAADIIHQPGSTSEQLQHHVVNSRSAQL